MDLPSSNQRPDVQSSTYEAIRRRRSKLYFGSWIAMRPVGQRPSSPGDKPHENQRPKGSTNRCEHGGLEQVGGSSIQRAGEGIGDRIAHATLGVIGS